ncbi:MAG: hypothetical protein ACQES4_05735 [Bacillota bacterium]
MKKLFAVLCVVLLMLGSMAMVGCGDVEDVPIDEELEDTDY